jgi:hypothetical protein
MGYVRHLEVAIDLDMGREYDGRGRVVQSTLDERVEVAVQAFTAAMGHIGAEAASVRYRTIYSYRALAKTRRLGAGGRRVGK